VQKEKREKQRKRGKEKEKERERGKIYLNKFYSYLALNKFSNK